MPIVLIVLLLTVHAIAAKADGAGTHPDGGKPVVASHPLPHIAVKDGRHALIVDGAPFLMLGVQINNSSSWPAMMPKVWPAVEYVHANTVEAPIYWQQFEPEPGRFDYSTVDMLLHQAREHRVRLVLLWFGTWKNGSGHYWPMWMKLDPERYPKMIGANGLTVDSPSPFAPALLAADKAAFTALMTHLKIADPEHTVIMVQVENEPGTWGSVRDYSKVAQQQFDSPVPVTLLSALGMESAERGRTWQEAFGPNAEVYFHSWSVARFIDQVAQAGKSAYSLPLYVNAALRDPIDPGPPGTYESGGATDNVLAVWKAAAPSIDILAPDIYMSDPARYLKVLDLYGRADNALFVPETGSGPEYARFCFAAVGHGALGFAPFGIDYTTARHEPDGAASVKTWLGGFREEYRALTRMDAEIARLNFEGRVRGVVEQAGEPEQTVTLGGWNVLVSFGRPAFGNANPTGNAVPIGGALIAETAPNQFLVTGLHCRVDFEAVRDPATRRREFLQVDEGSFVGDEFKSERIWNGDQTDWGLNFSDQPTVLRVWLGTY